MILGLCSYCKKEFRKREQKRKFCSLFCASRFNLNHSNKVTLPKKSKTLAEFVGICLGDGCASKYQTSVSLNATADALYIPYVTTLATKLFPGATVTHVKRVKHNVVDIRINSRSVASFMKSMGIVSHAKYVPSWIVDNPTYVKACIKGLFDTEGSISFKAYNHRKGTSIYKQLNFRNVNLNLMTFVRDSLLRMGFKPTMTLKKSLYLSNHASIELYRKTMTFGNPKLLERSLICDSIAYNKWINKKNQNL